MLAFLAPDAGPRPRRPSGTRRGDADPAHHRGPDRRGPRHPPSDRGQPLLRGPETGGQAPCPLLRRGADTEVPPLARARAPAQPGERRSVAGRQRPHLPRPVRLPAVEGLRYAFPNAMARLEPRSRELVALRDRVAAQPRIAAYLASDRRMPFNQQGIFRRYPELDAPAPRKPGAKRKGPATPRRRRPKTPVARRSRRPAARSGR